MKSNRKTHILFIGHEASLTGAPKSLLRIIKYLYATQLFKCTVLLKQEGELLNEYKNFATVFTLKEVAPQKKRETFTQMVLLGILRRLYSKGFIKLTQKEKWSKKVLNIADYKEHLQDAVKEKFNTVDIIFNNTITNGDILAILSLLEKPIITRVAEMNYVTNYWYAKSFQRTKQHTNHYLAVSNAVKKQLHARNIAHDLITVAYGSVDLQGINSTKEFDLKKYLGLPDDGFIVISSGMPTMRKGIDIFFQIALKTLKKNSKAYFIWLGGDTTMDLRNVFTHDCKTLKIDDRVFFLDTVVNPYDFYGSADLFLMTSREDPFPLVCLEAGVLGVPVLCFEGAGGTTELVNDPSLIVPYLDTDAMVEKVLELYQNESLLDEKGKEIKESILNKFTIDKTGVIIQNLILKLTNNELL